MPSIDRQTNGMGEETDIISAIISRERLQVEIRIQVLNVGRVNNPDTVTVIVPPDFARLAENKGMMLGISQNVKILIPD